MRNSKWKVFKAVGTAEWWAYKRYTDGPAPYVVSYSSQLFYTWREAMNWALADSRRPHA